MSSSLPPAGREQSTIPTPMASPPVDVDVSFIAIIEATKDARWLFVSDSVTDLLGWDPDELIGRSPFELMHPGERNKVEDMHFHTVAEDKAAAVAFLQFKHKDPARFVLCKIARSVVHDVLIGSVSAAQDSQRILQATSTAQEVEIISSDAARFCYRKWQDSSPPTMSFARASSESSTEFDSPSIEDTLARELQFAKLKPSERAGLILNRFSLGSTVMYCTNDLILDSKLVRGRFFFDFVHPDYQNRVFDWLSLVKGWAKSEGKNGPPADGGFYFGTFRLSPKGHRADVTSLSEAAKKRRGRPVEGGKNPSTSNKRRSKTAPRPKRQRGSASGTAGSLERKPPLLLEDEAHTTWVDAIFSAHSDGLIVILRQCESPPEGSSNAA